MRSDDVFALAGILGALGFLGLIMMAGGGPGEPAPVGEPPPPPPPPPQVLKPPATPVRTIAYGAPLWTEETENWAPGSGVSKRADYEEYNAPVESAGIIQVDPYEEGWSIGSAFATGWPGGLITARHVIDGCEKVMVQVGGTREDPVLAGVNRIVEHPEIDLAVLVNNEGMAFAPPSHLELHGKGRERESYHVGFPSGAPGAAHGHWIGQKFLGFVGEMMGFQTVDVWAEVSRVPDRSGSLGGMSGGLVLDEAGRVAGITVAEAPRRGRIMTTPAEDIAEFVRARGGDIPVDEGSRPGESAKAPPQGPTPRDYPAWARDLIVMGSVVKVFCHQE